MRTLRYWMGITVFVSNLQAEILRGEVKNTFGDPLDSVRVSVKGLPAAVGFTNAQGVFSLNTALPNGVFSSRFGTGSRSALRWSAREQVFRWNPTLGSLDIALYSLEGKVLARSGLERDRARTGSVTEFRPGSLPRGLFLVSVRAGARWSSFPAVVLERDAVFPLPSPLSEAGAALAKSAAEFTLVFERSGYAKKEMTVPAPAAAGIEAVLEFSGPREKALADYRKHYLGSKVTLQELAWTGDTGTCRAGGISELAQSRTLMRLNYYRRAVGLPPVVFSPALSALSQQAALLMAANKVLSHSPPATWRCFTEDGKTGAANSNLAGGNHSAQAVTQYMLDAGDNNTAVGHRRWLLYPKALELGHGSTSNYNAIYTNGKRSPAYPADMPAFVAWPPAGFVASPLVFPRWSFSVHNRADLSAAQVEMTGPDGKTTGQALHPYKAGYGEATIVWEPQGIDLKNAQDVTYTVKVTGVKGGRPDGTYTYQVTIFQAPK